MGYFILFLIVTALIIGGAIAYYKSEKKARLQKYSAFYTGIFKHVGGLPLAEGVLVEVFYGREKIIFKKEQQEISLECSRIIDMDTVFGKDVNAQAASGATAGAIIGGGIAGAAIGALLTSSLYFVITYNKDEEPQFIFLDTAASGSVANKIAEDFKAINIRETKEIEL